MQNDFIHGLIITAAEIDASQFKMEAMEAMTLLPPRQT